MRTLILVIVALILVSLASGCVMLRVSLTERGLSFGVQADMPEVPEFIYEKSLGNSAEEKKDSQ